jgi:putative ABC transport system substrate-binding protein
MKAKILVYALPALILATIHLAEAQQPNRMYRIGVLAVENPPPGLVENFREGLQDLGYIQGRNIAIESRNAQGRSEQLAALADELVRLKVDVILTVNTPAAVAAKNATTSIPIVITRVADPVKSGLVASLSHPGGNLTGLSFMPDDIGTKQLELLKEIRPSISRVAVLWHADNPGASIVVKQMEHTSSPLGLRFLRLPVRDAQDFLEALGVATRGRAEALFVVDDAMVTKHRFQILDLAAKRSLPVVSFYKEFVEAGGLFAYGASPPAIYRRAAALVDKILKGAKPADLPVEQPMKFEFIINLKAAKQIGLTIPQSVLVRADKVLK